MAKKNISILKSGNYGIYLIGMLIFLASAVLFEKNYNDFSYSEKDAENFEKVLHEKEIKLDNYLAKTEAMLDSLEENEKLFSGFGEEYFNLYEKHGISVFYYRDDRLEFWTDNQTTVPSRLNLLPEGKILSLGNSSYYSKKIIYDNATVLGLMLIKTENPYENRFLQNGFESEFEMDPEVQLVFDQESEYPEITNRKGEYLFSLDFQGLEQETPILKSFTLIFYFLFFILLLLLIRRIVHNWKGKGKNLVLFASMLFVILLMKLMSIYRFPSIIFDLDVFSAIKYSSSFLFSSIGDLFAAIFLLFFIAYNFYVDYKFPFRLLKKSAFARILLVVSFLFATILLYVFDTYVFKSLIVDSSISFETYKVLDLSVFTFLGFLMLALLYVAYVLLTDKILVVFANLGFRFYALSFVILQVVVMVILFISKIFPYLMVESLLLVAITSGLAYYYRFYRTSEYKFSNFVIYIIIFAVFTMIEVTKYSDLRHKSEMKMLAVNLSAEHDPIAEILFIDITREIKNDEELESILYSPVFDFEYLYSTVERKYFSGFWDKYDLQITICRPEDSVYVSPPDDSWYACYPFFYEEILSEGMQVPGTDFYYLDNLNGRISYFMSHTFREGRPDELTMFIELDSRLFAEGLGYPGLLLEDSYSSPGEQYSYAKYNDGRLITSTGEFAYSTSPDVYVSENDGFESFKFDNWDHLAYHLDSKNIIVVSKPSLFWVDVLISFSYIFSFYFLMLVILLLISKISPLTLRLKFDFKNRIQLAITSVLLVSFILFGAGTVYFSIQQYKDRQLEILEEKVQSVYIELIHKLEYETDLRNWSSDSYFSLNELLQKFSNVFYTDINLFTSNGQLLATSRSEIYDMGLISRRMNADAYMEMTVNKRSEYVHTEKIGNLDYLSVYVPFVNADNQMLAYLNLPYFTRQDELTREVANLVVAIINVVVLLSLLSLSIGVFVSNTVTLPLRLIQQKIARISLSEQNEKIEYAGKDEIGSLVNEYNEMVDQLKQSAELLAKSERETAWREMAKQIAHEIKNPLTPMKLNVQHLQRTYKEKGQNSNDQVDKISKMLIDQINDLSAIATEFSNFAKMPVADNEKLDLGKKLKNTIDLFTDYHRCSISLKIVPEESIYVFADREQISRVFINLVKNAIQSVPESRTGKVDILLEKKGDKAVVSITDNGKGISEDIKDKLFQPNFTTKSSGMGLGLSIVRNIVRNVGGNIYYETEMDKGTTFYVELPVLDTRKKGKHER